MTDTVVTNGTVVTATETYQADVGIEEGKVAALGRGLGGVEAIDAQGNYVFPGAKLPKEAPQKGTTAQESIDLNRRYTFFSWSVPSAVKPLVVVGAGV